MSKRFRTAVLLVLVLVFFLLGGAVVFYAQGWRAAFGAPQGPANILGFSIRKVGGIYLRTYPDDAAITLNGEAMERNTGIFERGLLAPNLFPQTYEVVVAKTGYKDWKSILSVEPSLVASHPAIVLVPQEARIASSGPIRNFQVFGNLLATETASGTVTASLPGAGNRPLPGSDILAGTANGSRVVTRTDDGAYFVTNLETATSTNITRAFPRFGLGSRATSTKIAPVPENPSLFLLAASSTLRLANLANGTLVLLEGEGDVAAATAGGSRIAWVTFDAKKKASMLSFYDLPSASFMHDVDVIPGRTSTMAFSNRDDLILLQEDGSLYTLSTNQGNRVKIATGVRHFSLNRDGSNLAFVDESGVSVISRGDRSYVYLRIPEPETARGLIWYRDSNHLFVSYPGRILFLDLHDTSLRNLTEVAPSETFAYLPERNEFYYLEKDVLKMLAFPE